MVEQKLNEEEMNELLEYLETDTYSIEKILYGLVVKQKNKKDKDS